MIKSEYLRGVWYRESADECVKLAWDSDDDTVLVMTVGDGTELDVIEEADFDPSDFIRPINRA